MVLRALCLLFCLGIGLSACQSAAPSFGAQDEAALRALFEGTASDIRAANWDGWAARYADDAVFHNAGAPALVGREALSAWARSFPRSEEWSHSDIQVSGEGNLAYGTSAIRSKMGGMVGTAKQLVVFRRDTNDRWWIQAVSVTPDELAGAPAPTPSTR